MNYGGIMQAWALQQVLKRMGHEPETLARNNDAHTESRLRLLRRNGLSFCKRVCMKLFIRGKYIYLCSPFCPQYSVEPKMADKGFVKKRIARSKGLFSDEALRLYIAQAGFEAFIVGSDQVWREEYSPRLETYFLDFLKDDDARKRIAYAVSFGTNEGYISDEKMPICRKLLRRFDAVSVRENGGVQIVQKDFEREDAVMTLDSSLLLTADEYVSLINKKDRRQNGSYVAAYILDDTQEKQLICRHVAARRNKPLKVQSCTYITGQRMPTVSQWLANFADADFVITDSFHGCVFSIIFHKPFIAIGNAGRGMERFLSLLAVCGLSHRLVLGKDDYQRHHDSLLSAPDYHAVDQKLLLLRANSIKFLEDALS